MEYKMTADTKWKMTAIVNIVISIGLLAIVIVLLCTAQKVQNATNIHIAGIVRYDTEKLEITMPDSIKYTVVGDTVESKVKISKLSEGIDNSMYISSSRPRNIDGLPISVKIFNSDGEKELQIYGWAIRFESKYYETNLNFSDIIIDILELSYNSDQKQNNFHNEMHQKLNKKVKNLGMPFIECGFLMLKIRRNDGDK